MPRVQFSLPAEPTSVVLVLGALWLTWAVCSRILQRSPLDNLSGPQPASWLTGSMRSLFNRHGWDFLDSLPDKYGSVSKMGGLFGARILYVFDPKALQHIILKDSHNYDETIWFIEGNILTFGPGLLGTVGDHHRKQRKTLNPVFSINHMRHMTPIFYKIAHQLRYAVYAEVKEAPKDLNMLEWMGRAALELIGQGGLGYSFDPLTHVVSNSYGDAMKAFLPTLFSLGALRFFSHYLKYLGSPSFRRKLVEISPIQNLRKLVRIIDQINYMSKEVFETKKQALAAGDAAVVQQIGEGKDIMSVLLKANMVASEEDRLQEDELLAQMTTLVFAATDTTSTALVQILQILAENPEAQDKLRAEIRAAGQSGDISYDALIALPYLDAICRETLRLHPPVSFVFREAHHNAVLPFSEPIQGRNGEAINEVAVPKGTLVIIGIRASNRNKVIWGEDALEWKPERWLSPLPKAVTEARIPGVYSNLMTFLGGGRSCIGFKFSQLEMKVILSVMIDTFKFSLPDNNDDVVWNLAGVRYPTVGKDTVKPSFPMKVERIRQW